MTHIEHFTAPHGVRPGMGYSHAVGATGRLVAIAGQVAMDEDGELVGPGDPAAQAEPVFENLGLVLAAAGASFSDVITFGIFVTDIEILPAVREVRDRYVDTARPPASTLFRWSPCSDPATCSRSRRWPSYVNSRCRSAWPVHSCGHGHLHGQ